VFEPHGSQGMPIPLFVIKLAAKAQRNEPNGKISPVLPFCAAALAPLPPNTYFSIVQQLP